MNLKLRSVIAVNYLVNLPMWRDNEGLVKLRELYIYNGVLYLKLVESKQSCSPESNGKEPKHICGAHRTSHGLHLAQWRPSTRLERPCHHDRAPAISKSNKKSKIDKKKASKFGHDEKKSAAAAATGAYRRTLYLQGDNRMGGWTIGDFAKSPYQSSLTTDLPCADQFGVSLLPGNDASPASRRAAPDEVADLGDASMVPSGQENGLRCVAADCPEPSMGRRGTRPWKPWWRQEGWEGVVEVAEQPCCAAGCHLSEGEREELERGEILGCLD